VSVARRRPLRHVSRCDLWPSSNFDTAVSNNWHRDSFALLNGSVFSIWYNVRKVQAPATIELAPNGNTRCIGSRCLVVHAHMSTDHGA
jgi:hypothetical protein